MDDLKLSENDISALSNSELDSEAIEYDASILSVAKSKWIFGQWEELATININEYIQHPERAKVALLVASAHQQMNCIDEAKKFISLAKAWGCDNELVSKLLISGIENSLAKIHALNKNNEAARTYFDRSLTMLIGESDANAIRNARSISELSNLGLIPQASEILDAEHKSITAANRPTNISAKVNMLATEIGLINHNIALSHEKNQLYFSGRSEKKEDFIEKLKQLSPSQLGQDLWVLEYFQYKRNGFFVEFGATDGVLLSNTYLLEKQFGWKGICAEPNANFFEQLVNNRGVTVSNSCIGRKTGEVVKFVFADEYGGIESFVKEGEHKEKVSAYENSGEVASLTTISLHEFLIKNNAPRTIDYLSVDTEGSEFSILEYFPFDEWNIKTITIEHNFEPQRELIFKLLVANGYTRIEQQWDDWYFKG